MGSTRTEDRVASEGAADRRPGPTGEETAAQIVELTRLIGAGAVGEGPTESPLSGLVYYRAARPEPRSPMVLDPSFCIVASGEKKAYLGAEVYTYDPLQYRVLAVPLPLEIEITRASEKEPFLAIALEIDPVELTELLLEMDDSRRSFGDTPPLRGISTSRLDPELRGAVIRLLRAVTDDARREVLAPLAIREILFHLLCGEQGDLLRALALRDGPSRRVARALRFIRDHYAESLDVPTIARAAHMSPSTLHHNFKAVTSISPIQYLKKVRLDRARLLMLHDDRTAAGAARDVGYTSPSQFSREFRRHFGEPPARHVRSLQAERVARMTARGSGTVAGAARARTPPERGPDDRRRAEVRPGLPTLRQEMHRYPA